MSLITGTVSIDTVRGVFTGGNIITQVYSFSFLTSQFAAANDPFLSTDYLGAQFNPTVVGTPPIFSLTLPVRSLVGYSGGSICSRNVNCTLTYTIPFSGPTVSEFHPKPH